MARARLQQNDRFFAASEPSAKSLQLALSSARQTGVLSLARRSLKELPAAAFDIGAVELPEGEVWWETRETLERLDASENALTTIPDALSALGELTELKLVSNKLVQLPAAKVWAALAALRALNLEHNALTSLPAGFGAAGAPPLALLDLRHNALRELPDSLCDIGSLEHLDIGHNQLEGLPARIVSLSKLRRLLAGHNRLQALPDGWSAAAPPHLGELSVEHNRLERAALRAPALHTLQLSHNALIALQLEGCEQLAELIAPYNKLSALPAALPDLPRLATVDLSNNAISAVDPALGRAPALTRLDLSNNALREVPPQLGLLTGLAVLSLGGNTFRSPPPAMLAGPTSKLLAFLRNRLPADEAAGR